MLKKTENSSRQDGFTLVELMVTLVLVIIVTSLIYSTYSIQQHTAVTQGAVAEMQQNIRAALTMMSFEMRMAGAKGHCGDAPARITVAERGRISFSMDRYNDAGENDCDGDITDPGEQIDYGFDPTEDADDNGILDVAGSITTMKRQANGGGYQAIAGNFEAIEFYYTLLDGTRLLSVVGNTQLRNIRSVEVSLLVRAGRVDNSFTNTQAYLPGSNADLGNQWGPYNDNFRRRLLITDIKFRNL